MPPRMTSTLVLDELRRHRRCDGVVGRAVLEVQLQRPPEQPALGVDVTDDHPGDVGVGTPHERQRARLVGDHSHLDGIGAGVRRCLHGLLLCHERAGRATSGRASWEDRAPPPAAETSGGLPIFDTPLRLSELVATLALAQDNAFGQPLESQLRSCLLATSICEAAGFDAELRDTVYWVALLRYVGCTGHAHEVATVFGDEIAIRAQTLVHDAANPAEVMRDVMEFATAGRTPGRAGRDRPDDPGDGPRVGGLQLQLGLRGRRHARRSGSTSAPPCVRLCASRSSAGTATATPATRRVRRSRSRCASCT